MIDVTRRIQRYLCAEFAAGAEGLVAINERSKIARQRHASPGVERLGTPQRGAETFVVRVAVPATGAMAARVYLPINFTVAPRYATAQSDIGKRRCRLRYQLRHLRLSRQPVHVCNQARQGNVIWEHAVFSGVNNGLPLRNAVCGELGARAPLPRTRPFKSHASQLYFEPATRRSREISGRNAIRVGLH